MARLHFMDGDATAPYGEGGKVIVHCCNNQGKWGSGFVVALSKKWPEPEQHYRESWRKLPLLPLGTVSMVRVEPDIVVANLIGQDGIINDENDLPPVRYEAIRKGFTRIVMWLGKRDRSIDLPLPISIHMPRIGCGLAGGDWALIERLIEATFLRADIDVTVYDFPGGIPFFDSRTPDSVPYMRKTEGSVP